MIFPLAGLVVGALLGAVNAAKRGGNRLDLLQWGAVGAMIGGLAGLVVLISWARQGA